jgi:hypothetical protein
MHGYTRLRFQVGSAVQILGQTSPLHLLPSIHIVCQEFHRYDTSNSWTAYPNSTYPGSENVARSRPDSLLSKNINLFSHNYASWQLVGWRNGSAWPSYPSGYNQAKAAGSSPVLIEMG